MVIAFCIPVAICSFSQGFFFISDVSRLPGLLAQLGLIPVEELAATDAKQLANTFDVLLDGRFMGWVPKHLVQVQDMTFFGPVSLSTWGFGIIWWKPWIRMPWTLGRMAQWRK